jgi:D-beta-D-heptose 7-phosphate kinase/D-beta-D-heptose 1-phosphate adenosyltransferase
MIDSGVFGNSSDLKERLKTLEEIGAFAQNSKGLGLKVVMTQGSYDLFHIGHKAYLARAKSFGDLLIVGVDDDEKIRKRKGKDRPMVPQEERLDVLAGLRSVDVLVLKEIAHPKWALIKAVRPDVLVVSESTKQFTEEEKNALREFCGEVVVLPPQAKTSTSARIRNFQLEIGARIKESMMAAVPGIVESVTGALGDKKE